MNWRFKVMENKDIRNIDDDGYGDKNSVEQNHDMNQENNSQSEQLPSDANNERNDYGGNSTKNDTSIPFEIDGDDEIQEEVVPRIVQIPPEIRNDDNPADVGQ